MYVCLGTCVEEPKVWIRIRRRGENQMGGVWGMVEVIILGFREVGWGS